MINPAVIEAALQQVRDEQSFIQTLLVDTLHWDLPEGADRVSDLGYAWTPQDLNAPDLSKKLVASTVHQIVLPTGPWAVFLLEFKNPDAFNRGRGLTGPLRKVLRGLLEKLRRDPSLPAFKRENLLFICTHRFTHYRFAHFKQPFETSRTSPLAMFGWNPDEPARTACEMNLPHLEWPANDADADWAAHWTAAFDVERVTKRFYTDYKAAFELAEQAIGKKNKLTPDELRLFTQTLFNRLMFVRFLERKGWLEFGNHSDYLQALHEAGGIGKQSLYQTRLRPLFFDALAKPLTERPAGTDKRVGRVPFLNGGLFELKPLDEKVTDVPDAVFAKLLAPAGQASGGGGTSGGGGASGPGLFYRYHFTIQESTPLDVEVAVDPEMLGKVFEELVTGRHESGSYYTPRPVVAFMCREALKGCLAHRTSAPADALEALVDDHEVLTTLTTQHADEIRATLDRLKAVDPACGSGAYLLGLLHELLSVYQLLYNQRLTQDARSSYDLKLRIISHNLYGVDIDPFATNIAMLRLWLSLSVEADQPDTPLPNLDFKIETGDALLGPDPQAVPDLFLHALHLKADLLQQLKDQYLRSHGKPKAKLKEDIFKLEADIREKLQAHLGPGVIDWRVQFAEVFAPSKVESYTYDGKFGFAADAGPQTAFKAAEAYEKGGFDIVLANPPYVRKEKINPEVKPILRSNFSDAITGRSDLYCSFYARAVQLLCPGGVQVFVCSSAWLDAEYGGVLQHFLLQNGLLKAVYDSAVEKQFSTANVNTVITIFQKQAPSLPRDVDARFVLLTGPFESAIVDERSQRVTSVSNQALLKAGKVGADIVGDKWGGRYLRAPAIYKKILEECATQLVFLSNAATIIGYIHDNNTGDEFPSTRVLWQVSATDVIGVDDSSDSVQTIGVKEQGNSASFAPLLFARQHGLRHLVIHVTRPVLGKEFYRITPNADWSEFNLAAQLNSTWAILQRELLGIKGFGGGALKFAARDVGLFTVIDGLEERRLSRAFNQMRSRVIGHGPKELLQSDRRELDAVIFDAMDLTDFDREAVYAAVIELQEMRSTRAAN